MSLLRSLENYWRMFYKDAEPASLGARPPKDQSQQWGEAIDEPLLVLESAMAAAREYARPTHIPDEVGARKRSGWCIADSHAPIPKELRDSADVATERWRITIEINSEGVASVCGM